MPMLMKVIITGGMVDSLLICRPSMEPNALLTTPTNATNKPMVCMFENPTGRKYNPTPKMVIAIPSHCPMDGFSPRNPIPAAPTSTGVSPRIRLTVAAGR